MVIKKIKSLFRNVQFVSVLHSKHWSQNKTKHAPEKANLLIITYDYISSNTQELRILYLFDCTLLSVSVTTEVISV